jgi:hypothetical protein
LLISNDWQVLATTSSYRYQTGPTPQTSEQKLPDDARGMMSAQAADQMSNNFFSFAC